jgi:tubulin-folding cofactor B
MSVGLKNLTMNTSPILTLFLTGPFSACEKRFDKSMPISQVKERLEMVTGISAFQMNIKVKELGIALEGEHMLGYYPLQDYMTLLVSGTGPIKVDYNNLEGVEKIEMDDEEYDKRTDSVRHFKRKHKLGRFQDVDPTKEDEFEEEALKIQVGDRCLVTSDGMEKRGEIKFVGKAEFKPGYWIGVEYDEPIGKHNGTVGDKAYFKAKSKHGAFVRPNLVQVGDYPEEDLFDDEF